MLTKKFLHTIQDKFFNLFIIISWFLIIISALGFSQSAPKFLEDLDYYIRIYICLFLMWRFNPLRYHYEFTDLDRKIAFSAGLFMLTTTALNKYLIDTQSKIISILQN
jgi:hypothetical protein